MSSLVSKSCNHPRDRQIIFDFPQAELSPPLLTTSHECKNKKTKMKEFKRTVQPTVFFDFSRLRIVGERACPEIYYEAA